MTKYNDNLNWYKYQRILFFNTPLGQGVIKCI